MGGAPLTPSFGHSRVKDILMSDPAAHPVHIEHKANNSMILIKVLYVLHRWTVVLCTNVFH